MAVDTDIRLRTEMMYSIFVRNYSKEGTLKAVAKDLDRIHSLGTDIIWLMPVQPTGTVQRKGSLGSPYAIQDYRRVDPALGTMEDFHSLCWAIHEKGMKVILDVVYHHTSPDAWLVRNHPEWFYRKQNGSFGNHIGDWTDIIDFDFSDHALWDYLIDTLKMWAEDVDGFRCDVAPLVPTAFWKEARQKVSEVRPGCLWLAESSELPFVAYCRREGIGSASDSELYEAFDICYDYDVSPLFEGYTRGRNSLAEYAHALNVQECIYPKNYVKLRYLENHDRPRAAQLIQDDSALINWTAFSGFNKGITMIYNGQEKALEHQPTLFDPDPLAWDQGRLDLSDLIRKVADLHADPFFADTSIQADALDPDVLQYVHTGMKKDPEEPDPRRCAGIFSFAGKPLSVRTSLPDGTYHDLLNDRDILIHNGQIDLDEKPLIFWL
jgi:glycosidase